MLLSDFDYELPPERIAQQPLAQRDASRLLWLHRGSGQLEDRRFAELPQLLRPGDLLVANDSRVFPARLLGRRPSGGEVEVLLLEPGLDHTWNTLARPGRKLPLGTRITFAPGFEAEVVGRGPRGERQLRFHYERDFFTALERYGQVPLPPYIHRPHGQSTPADRERYQTVYAQPAGSVRGSAAAPTAGLHFTPEVLARLADRGIEWTTVSLHVGLGTFQPVVHERVEDHPIHAEHYQISTTAAAALNRARLEHRRIIAIGTTAVRVLETAAPPAGGAIAPGIGVTRLYLYPGRPFQVIDAMLTNFHAPRTTLLVMIAAFAGLDHVRHAYAHALQQGYRFLSYGDCMLIDS